MTQPPMTPGYQMQPTPQQGGGLATAAFVLGIVALCVSIVLFCIPPLGGLLGVLAIVLGVISMSQSGGGGRGKTGLILGVIAVVISGAIFIAARAGLSVLQKKSATWQQDLQKKAQDIQKQAEDDARKQQEELRKQQQNMTTQPGAAVPCSSPPRFAIDQSDPLGRSILLKGLATV
jgi:membrane protein insertase Oxa1/YidC/SpoIIIJ